MVDVEKVNPVFFRQRGRYLAAAARERSGFKAQLERKKSNPAQVPSWEDPSGFHTYEEPVPIDKGEGPVFHANTREEECEILQ